MKRTFDQIDQDFALIAGNTAKVLQASAGQMAMKFLFSAQELSAASGTGGTGLAGIMQLTGATITTNGAIYPGTQPPLQELNISGGSTEVVLGAVIHVLAQILQEIGSLTNGEDGVLPGDARLKTVVPIKAAAGIIGKGGENVKQMRSLTGLHIHLDKSEIPPGGGDLAEQLVVLSGNLAGIQAALPMLAEQVALYAAEPWFAGWFSNSNAGKVFPGIVLEMTGKGMKGGGKGISSLGSMPVTSSSPGLGVSGEVCKFFARAGWCKYGDACRHSHVSDQSAVALAAATSGPPSGEVCQFFAKAGWCKYGDACRHSHTGVAGGDANSLGAAVASQLMSLGLGAALGVDVAGSGLGVVQQQEGEICGFFARAGWCKFGDACRYQHTNGGAAVTPPPAAGGTPSGQICQFFARSGWCKYGDACRHTHTSQVATDLIAGLAGLAS